MQQSTKLITTLVLLVLLGGLGAADYFYADGGAFRASLDRTNGDSDKEPDTTSAVPGGVAKFTGPDVQAVAIEEGFTAQESSDLTLLAQVASGEKLSSLTILADGDRAGSVTWLQSPDVKNIFLALKEALIEAFSPELTDLRDETIQQEEQPVMNLLTFRDPQISDERIIFIRIRERLYEFHVTEGKEASMDRLIEALTH